MDKFDDGYVLYIGYSNFQCSKGKIVRPRGPESFGM